MGKSLFKIILEAMPNYEWVISKEISERLNERGLNLSPKKIAGIIRGRGSIRIEVKKLNGNTVIYRKK